VLVSGSADSFAHHSDALYSQEVVRVEGEVVSVNWRNPHVTWTFRAVDDAGEEEFWVMEAPSTYSMKRAGVDRDLFIPGSRITILGRVSTREDKILLATDMRLSDGREFLLYGKIAGSFDDESRLVDATAENKGFFRVWSFPAELFKKSRHIVEHLPYTDEAIAARTSWDPLDNYAIRCEPEGMPTLMLKPHPFEFIDQGDRLVLHNELHDIRRVIHLGRSVSIEEEPPSRLGYSAGIWNDGALIVRTTGINWPYFDNIGTPLSEDVVIAEKFWLSDDQSRLNYRINITDPTTFIDSAHVEAYWLALGEDMPPDFDCLPGRPET
jgi:hypothetical protein